MHMDVIWGTKIPFSLAVKKSQSFIEQISFSILPKDSLILNLIIIWKSYKFYKDTCKLDGIPLKCNVLVLF